MVSAIEMERSRYREVLSAVEELVDEALDAKALSMLRAWDTHTYVHAPDFSADLELWPYAGDPKMASQAELMFFAFQEARIDRLQDQFLGEIFAFSAHAISTWELPMRKLIEEACSFDEDLLPSLEIDKSVLQANAVQALSLKILELLKFADSDILLDD